MIMKKGMNLSILFKVVLIMTFVLSGVDGITGNTKKTGRTTDTQMRDVGLFTSIKSSSSVDVFITQGTPQSVKVVADESVIDKIITEVNGDVLHVYAKDIRNCSSKMAVYVTLKELKGLKMTGSGDVYSENTINSEGLEFKVTGSGDLDLDLNVTNVDGEITGSGDVNLSGVKGIFKIQVVGSGDLNASQLDLDECYVSLSGSGDIRLSGVCNSLNINGSSSGDISASKLETKECKISKTGSGDVSIWVIGDLYVKSSGSGDVYYKGSPNVNSNVSGSGDIRAY